MFHQRLGLFVRVWHANGVRMWHRSMAVVRARVWHLRALARVCVCVQNMTNAHVKMKCKGKNGTFHINYKLN